MPNRISPVAIALGIAALTALPSCRTAPTPPTNSASKHPAKPDTPAQKRYSKVVEDDRLGPIWYQLVKIHEDQLDVGTVTVTFDIPAAGGKVQNVQVTSNTGGWLAKHVALHAVDQLRAPPIPSQVMTELHSDHMQFEESFTIFYQPVKSQGRKQL